MVLVLNLWECENLGSNGLRQTSNKEANILIPLERNFLFYFDCFCGLLLVTESVFFSVSPFLFHIAERNTLSFIETSALDSTNVEQAFVQILTGKCTFTRPYQSELLKRLQHQKIALNEQCPRAARKMVPPHQQSQ